MSVQSRLMRLRIAPALADLFATPTAGWIYPLFESAEANCTRKNYERKPLVSDHFHFPGVLGEPETGFKIGMEMRGFGGAPLGAGSGVQASDGENGLLLLSCFGAQQKDTGTVLASGSTLSVLKVASSTNLTVGNFLGLVGSDGLYYTRQLRAKTTTDLTLDRALPAAAFGSGPASGATLYASNTFTKATFGHQHLFADVEGYDPAAASNFRRYLYGLLGNVSFKNLQANGRAMMEFDFKGVNWASSPEGTSQGAPTYPTNMPAVGDFIRNTRMSVDANAQLVQNFDLDLGNDIQPRGSTAAPGGISSFFVRDSKLEFKFSALHDDAGAALRAKWEAQTPFDLLVELTQGGPGNSFAIAAPVVKIKDCKTKDQGGLLGYDFTCDILRNDATATPPIAFGVL